MGGFFYGENMSTIRIDRAESFPHSCTFKIKPVKALIEDYIHDGYWIDPFVRESVFKNICVYTNDLNPEIEATINVDALDFLTSLEGRRFDGVLFDPPFSPTQIKRAYDGIGKKLLAEHTQSCFYSKRKDAATKLIKIGGLAICCGWNSHGFGKSRGFELERVLIVSHYGGNRNDTIITVERKIKHIEKN